MVALRKAKFKSFGQVYFYVKAKLDNSSSMWMRFLRKRRASDSSTQRWPFVRTRGHGVQRFCAPKLMTFRIMCSFEKRKKLGNGVSRFATSRYILNLTKSSVNG